MSTQPSLFTVNSKFWSKTVTVRFHNQHEPWWKNNTHTHTNLLVWSVYALDVFAKIFASQLFFPREQHHPYYFLCRRQQHDSTHFTAMHLLRTCKQPLHSHGGCFFFFCWMRCVNDQYYTTKSRNKPSYRTEPQRDRPVSASCYTRSSLKPCHCATYCQPFAPTWLRQWLRGSAWNFARILTEAEECAKASWNTRWRVSWRCCSVKCEHAIFTYRAIRT